jgi:putative membrane protein
MPIGMEAFDIIIQSLYLVVLIIPLLIAAVWVYRDAKGRGRNGLVWALLVAIPGLGFLSLVVYLLIVHGFKRSPEEILDERYAKGEISREEYFRMKDDLRKK